MPKQKPLKLNRYNDRSGNTFLKVKNKHLKEFGLLNAISPYSHMQFCSSYLVHNDAMTFLNYLSRNSIEYEIEDRYTERWSSVICNYPVFDLNKIRFKGQS